MADAIRACGLEPVMLRSKEVDVLKGATRAYLLARVPVILIGSVYAENEPDREKGVHAVVVTGFGTTTASNPSGLPNLEAYRLGKLYAHDDGVGPFARMEFISGGDGEEATLTTSAAPTSDGIGSHFFRPEGLLIPVYHKIRVAYPNILAQLSKFDSYLAWLRENGAHVAQFIWDIRLTTVNDYKRECIDNAALGTRRRTLLEAPMPRFMWLVRGIEGASGAVDLLFDATGLETTDLCFRSVTHGTDIVEWLRVFSDAVPSQARDFGCDGIVRRLIESQPSVDHASDE